MTDRLEQNAAAILANVRELDPDRAKLVLLQALSDQCILPDAPMTRIVRLLRDIEALPEPLEIEARVAACEREMDLWREVEEWAEAGWDDAQNSRDEEWSRLPVDRVSMMGDL